MNKPGFLSKISKNWIYFVTLQNEYGACYQSINLFMQNSKAGIRRETSIPPKSQLPASEGNTPFTIAYSSIILINKLMYTCGLS